jgi:hypothetical protein
MHQAVPYFAQWGSAEGVRAIVEDGADPCADPAWADAGFDNEDEYRFWARRICGLACLESVLTHWSIPAPPRADMVRSALKWGAYRLTENRLEGLTYTPFADWVQADFGIQVEIHPRLPAESVGALLDSDSFVIASVSSEIRYPARSNTRKGGHLVLIHGTSHDGLVFHNPSGVPPYQADAHVSLTTFARFYADRAMQLRRPNAQ